MAPDFADTATFPPFDDCPESSSTHFLLGQISENMTITKPTLVLHDRVGAPFALVFDGDRGLDLRARGLRKGRTAVVAGARRTPPREEGKRGFVSVAAERADDEVWAIPGPLERVLEVGAQMRGASKSCSCCGTDADTLKCTACGEARYCSKTCQTKDWGDGHKTDCKIAKAINEIWGEK